MTARPSAANDAAKKQFEKAPEGEKPSARELAAKHGLAESSIHRSVWFVPQKNRPKAR